PTWRPAPRTARPAASTCPPAARWTAGWPPARRSRPGWPPTAGCSPPAPRTNADLAGPPANAPRPALKTGNLWTRHALEGRVASASCADPPPHHCRSFRCLNGHLPAGQHGPGVPGQPGVRGELRRLPPPGRVGGAVHLDHAEGAAGDLGPVQ